VLVTLPVNLYLLHQALAWSRDDRAPTDRERLDMVLLPLRQTASSLVAWIGGAVVFGVLNPEPGRVSLGILAAGLLTCAILFQLLERRLRPVMALALDGVRLPGRMRWILPRLLLAWFVASALPLALIGIGSALLDGPERADLFDRIPSLAFIAVMAGGLVMVGAARAVSDPLNEVRDALGRVAEGDLDVRLPVDHVGEIGQLQDGVNQMVEGLEERRRIEELFSRQVGGDVARNALARDPGLGGEERDVSVLFVDLAGFTAFAENHAPTEIVEHLNRFFAAVVAVIGAEGGWLDKFEGDAALCVFGAPADQPDHAGRALRAAAALPAAVRPLPEAPAVGVGVASGTVVAGNVGTPERYEYTVIGDPVNVAARLADLAKTPDGATGLVRGVLAERSTIDSARATAGAGEVPDWRCSGEAHLRGRRAPVEVWLPRPFSPTSRTDPATEAPDPEPRANAPAP
jgi:adenylate cyclase